MKYIQDFLSKMSLSAHAKKADIFLFLINSKEKKLKLKIYTKEETEALKQKT